MKLIGVVMFSLIVNCFCISQDLAFERVGTFTLASPLEITNSGIAGDDRLFIVERGGSIRIVDGITGNSPTLLVTPFFTVSNISSSGEGGLLGLAFDPDYENNGYFFVSYTTNQPGSFTSRISRFQNLTPLGNVTTGVIEEIVIEVAQPNNNHNGGDIAFGPDDGYLYIPLGDGGSFDDPGNNGQDSTTLLGSMLRIDVSSLDTMNTPAYTIPGGNPFTTLVTDPDSDIPDEIWSVGWRNPWRFSFDSQDGRMFIADVGQGALEEIDIELANDPGGKNYGWRCYEGSNAYITGGCAMAQNFTGPVYSYGRSLGRSITGGMVYRGLDYPSLTGKYIATDYLQSQRFWVLTTSGSAVTNDDVQVFSGAAALSRVAGIGDDIEGELYAAELLSGEIYKITSSVLPVVLKSFRTSKDNHRIIVEWTSSSEVNSDFYSLEKSYDGKEFSEIYNTKSKGGPTIEYQYSYMDVDGIREIQYYRLKMVDLDNTFKYSDVKIVRSDKIAMPKTVLFPNPTNNIINIVREDLSDFSGISYQLLDLDGRLLQSATLGYSSKSYQVALDHLPPGLYMMHVESGDRKEVHRVVIY